ncbi:hypothetical protein PSAB6_250088 [Paraburkholderia sabiae]|nr:hypothetical protein PSAB6_250088 [Paraburkholderia sabiae]
MDRKVFHIRNIEGSEKLLHEFNSVVAVNSKIVKDTSRCGERLPLPGPWDFSTGECDERFPLAITLQVCPPV